MIGIGKALRLGHNNFSELRLKVAGAQLGENQLSTDQHSSAQTSLLLHSSALSLLPRMGVTRL